MKTTPQAVAKPLEENPTMTPETTATVPITNGPAIGSEDIAVAPATRTETDSLGSLDVPADAYWGIHTARALENFPITRRAIFNYPDLIVALARVKQAGARANRDLGNLSPAKADVIEQVCQEIVDGQWHDQFVVGVIQGGAGTSTNMNTNEVIANRGLEIMGLPRGDYSHLHPIDDVNRSQSTNDVYPTAIKLAMVFSLLRLLAEHKLLTASFAAKGKQEIQDYDRPVGSARPPHSAYHASDGIE